jgi:hypothetical protein
MERRIGLSAPDSLLSDEPAPPRTRLPVVKTLFQESCHTARPEIGFRTRFSGNTGPARGKGSSLRQRGGTGRRQLSRKRPTRPAFTIASEIGDINRFASPTRLCGDAGPCPRVIQSGNTDRRGPISKHGPKYLRWALFEVALHACSPALSRALRAHQAAPQPPARPRGRPDRPLQEDHRGDLAHAHPQPTFAPAGVPFV